MVWAGFLNLHKLKNWYITATCRLLQCMSEGWVLGGWVILGTSLMCEMLSTEALMLMGI